MEYLAASFFSDRISGDGPFSHRCVDALATHLDSERVLLTPSCTSALEMSALLSGVGPGDEVIVPSFTFVSSANAFLLFGAHAGVRRHRPGALQRHARVDRRRRSRRARRPSSSCTTAASAATWSGSSGSATSTA